MYAISLQRSHLFVAQAPAIISAPYGHPFSTHIAAGPAARLIASFGITQSKIHIGMRYKGVTQR